MTKFYSRLFFGESRRSGDRSFNFERDRVRERDRDRDRDSDRGVLERFRESL